MCVEKNRRRVGVATAGMGEMAPTLALQCRGRVALHVRWRLIVSWIMNPDRVCSWKERALNGNEICVE